MLYLVDHGALDFVRTRSPREAAELVNLAGQPRETRVREVPTGDEFLYLPPAGPGDGGAQ